MRDISFIHGEPKRVVGVEILDQTYKAVHQIFDAVDFTIEQLDLVTYAHLTKKDLPREWRNLTEQEINLLKMLQKGVLFLVPRKMRMPNTSAYSKKSKDSFFKTRMPICRIA